VTTPSPGLEQIDEEKEQLPPVAPTIALSPRFNYMDEQLTHKMEDLKVEELNQVDVTEDTSYETIDSTIGIIPEMTTHYENPTEVLPKEVTTPSPGLEQIDEEKEQLPPVAPTIALSPRFNYMDEQLTHKMEDLKVEELNQVDVTEDTSYETIDSTIGIIPGMNGFVRKTKKLDREERQQLLGEMEEKYGAVMEDIREEFGVMLNEERRKLRAESDKHIQEMSVKLNYVVTELEKTKRWRISSWLPYW